VSGVVLVLSGTSRRWKFELSWHTGRKSSVKRASADIHKADVARAGTLWQEAPTHADPQSAHAHHTVNRRRAAK